MNALFDPAVPIYTQIVDHVARDICNKKYAPGQRIAPVREMALELNVNPNTLQRALAELERIGLLRTERTSGRFVTDNAALIETLRQELRREIVTDFIQKMRGIGNTDEQIIKTVKDRLEE